MSTLSKVLISLVLILLTSGAAGGLVWHARSLEAKATALQADLDKAVNANATLTSDLAAIKQQADADKLQVTQLAAQLAAIGTTQQTAKVTLAKVVKDASPSDQDLLNRQLPDAVLRLLPTSADDTGTDAAGAAKPSG